MSRNPVVVIQGGAGTHAKITEDLYPKEEMEDGVIQAARAGYESLMAGGSAIDAVEAAVVSMENNIRFNAGRGSCVTKDGKVEMDASIMDGATLAAGGVACITNVANPVSVSRLVMEKSQHVMLVSDGARKFAEKMGAKMVTDEYLMTDKSLKKLDIHPEFMPSVKKEFYSESEKKDYDTVGAVALDRDGNLAYATSTGGINAKEYGRAGDSPIVGAGGFAENAIGAISTTGHGEAFMKTCVAKHAICLMQQGMTTQRALEEALHYVEQRVHGHGGCVGLDTQGHHGVYFTTEAMAWACAKDAKISYGIYPSENTTIDISK